MEGNWYILSSGALRYNFTLSSCLISMSLSISLFGWATYNVNCLFHADVKILLLREGVNNFL